jgi:hypothetical protein
VNEEEYKAVRAERLRRVDFIWESPRTYETTICQARYDRTYEGGLWYAFRGEREWLDEDQGCDIECPSWWHDYRYSPIGRGDTPNDALADLERALSIGKDAYAKERDAIDAERWK